MNNHTGYFVNVQRGIACFGSYHRSAATFDLSNRERIGKFTVGSSKRLRRYIRNAKAEYRAIITLTYPPGYGSDGRTAKRDLDAFIKAYRRRSGDDHKWSVVWFLEWQQNGRLHFHLFGTNFINHDWVAETWARIVGSKNPNHLKAGTSIEKIRGGRPSLIAYASKYASKIEQKIPPKGFGWTGRYWGVRGLKTVVEASTSWKAWYHDDPGVFEARENLKKQVLQGGSKKILKKIGERSITIYVWQISNEPYRVRLVTALGEINKALGVCNEKRN